MAFGIGGPGPEAEDDNVLADINVTPLVDVMLVLLVIFMVTAPMLHQGIAVNLPRAQAENLPQRATEPLIVTINKDGLVYVRDEPIHASQLADRLVPAVKATGQETVFLRADQVVEYGRVVEVLDLLHRGGVDKINMVTQEPAGKPGPRRPASP